MDMAERNKEIYICWKNGESLKEIANKYNLSSERIRQIVQKEQLRLDRLEAKRKLDEELYGGERCYPFLEALHDARIIMNCSRGEIRVYNMLYRAGILKDIFDGKTTMDDYSDEQLLSIRYFGIDSVALARKAYELWKTNNELYLSKHPNAVLN